MAAARNGVIGRDNGLPWRLPADLRHFKAVTMGKPLLMGRKTFDSIGKALPGRANIVLTRDRQWQAPGVIVVHSIAEAFERAAGAAELAGIGGAEVFKLLLPLASRIYLTRVAAEVAGDTLFPEINGTEWRETEHQRHPADERNAYDMEFVTLQRVPAAGR